MVGDVVGEIGREVLIKFLYKNQKKYDLIIVNGENSAHGFGITPKIAKMFLDKGVDIITLGNHTWDRKEIYEFLNTEKNIIRPYNFHKTAPGKGYTIIEKRGLKIAVINLQGKVYMNPIQCPFLAVDELVSKLKNLVDIIIVDFHAEVTSEKQAMGWNLAGVATIVYGTHTHVQTADEKILKDKTAYITDIGMTGGHGGVLGMNYYESLKKFKDGMPARYTVCMENPRINAIEVEIDEKSKSAISINRINLSIEEI